MALSCRGEVGQIMSFKLSRNEWSELSSINKTRHHLKMDCCDSRAILKRSKYGTQFFAHGERGECRSTPKSAEHMLVQEVIAKAIEASGWAANVEFRHPCGEWIADVFAERDGQKIAFEVQLSPQHIEETQRRHERYMKDGIRCVWLLPLKKIQAISVFPPLFYLSIGKEDQALTIHLFNRNFANPTLHDFVISVLDGRQVTDKDGIQHKLYQINNAPLTKLGKIAYIKAAIVTTIESNGGTAEIDVRYEATRPKYNHSNCPPIYIREGEWIVDVMAQKGDIKAAFHVSLSENQLWSAERQFDHYAKSKSPKVIGVWLVQNKWLYKSLKEKRAFVLDLPEICRGKPIHQLDFVVKEVFGFPWK